MGKISFVSNGNQVPLPRLVSGAVSLSVGMFKERLKKMGICPVYIAQGNYINAFRELLDEPYLLTGYMQHRKKMLHLDALSQARFEYSAMEDSSFSA